MCVTTTPVCTGHLASFLHGPSPAPVFGRLQYKYGFAYCKQSKTGLGEGLDIVVTYKGPLTNQW